MPRPVPRPCRPMHPRPDRPMWLGSRAAQASGDRTHPVRLLWLMQRRLEQGLGEQHRGDPWVPLSTFREAAETPKTGPGPFLPSGGQERLGARWSPRTQFSRKVDSPPTQQARQPSRMDRGGVGIGPSASTQQGAGKTRFHGRVRGVRAGPGGRVSERFSLEGQLALAWRRSRSQSGNCRSGCPPTLPEASITDETSALPPFLRADQPAPIRAIGPLEQQRSRACWGRSPSPTQGAPGSLPRGQRRPNSPGGVSGWPPYQV